MAEDVSPADLLVRSEEAVDTVVHVASTSSYLQNICKGPEDGSVHYPKCPGALRPSHSTLKGRPAGVNRLLFSGESVGPTDLRLLFNER